MKLAFTFGVLLLLSSVAVAQEDKPPMAKSDLPEAISKAFDKSYPKAEVTGYDSEVLEGTTYYEVETKADELEKDYVYLADGSLDHVEEQVQVESLPGKVVEAVHKAHPGGTIDEAVKITLGNGVVYEIAVEVDEKDIELLVSADGTIQPSEEPGVDDGDDGQGESESGEDDGEEDEGKPGEDDD